MKFLFSHRNFPAQFRHLLIKLGSDPQNEVIFLTGTESPIEINGVKKYLYKLKRNVPKNCHRYLKQYEESINHGQAAAEVLISLKKQGFQPDVIYAHGWGNSLFFKDIFPNTPLINYAEWYYKAEGAEIGFDGITPNYDQKALVRCNNSHFLQDLVACDKAICPTQWQKSQIPKEFHNKISIIHDGIDTDYFIPNSNVQFKIPRSDIVLTPEDEVLTYATRGMEPMRGFPEFMKIANKLLNKRPNLHVVIAGQDRVCYGPKLINTTYKEMMLKQLKPDLSRLHFTDGLPYIEYRKLLQVSSVHCYLTKPFVLSWSMLEAMATGCLIVASKTPPVEEVMADGENGYLIDFFDIDGFAEKINEILDNKDNYKAIKENARNTIIEKYDLKKLLPKHIEAIKECALKAN